MHFVHHHARWTHACSCQKSVDTVECVVVFATSVHRNHHDANEMLTESEDLTYLSSVITRSGVMGVY